MFRPSRLAALFAAVVIALFGAVVPAHANTCTSDPNVACTLDVGHVDGVWVKLVSGALQVWVGDHTSGSTIERPPSKVTLKAKAGPGPTGSQTTVPSPASPSCLGTPGDPVWILPQIQNTNLLWLGWSAELIGSGLVTGNQVVLKLNSVTPPAGGVLCGYSNGLSGPTVIFNSSAATPQSVTIPVGAGGHRHINWAWTKSGAYTVKFEVTANGGALSSGEKTYTFQIA